MADYINPQLLAHDAFAYHQPPPDMFTSQPYAENPLSAHSSLQSIHPEPKPPNGGFQYVNPAEEIDDDEEDEDDEDEGPSRKRKRGNTGAKGKKPPEGGRRSINIAYIDDRAKRHITFSKRKSGIMKKAYELSTLTGTEVMLLVVSESGLVYTYTTQKFEAMVANAEGKNMITACLNEQIKVHTKSTTPPTPQGLPHSPRSLAKRPPSNPTINGNEVVHPQIHGQPPLPPMPQPAIDPNLSNIQPTGLPMPPNQQHLQHYPMPINPGLGIHHPHPQQQQQQQSQPLHHDPQMLVNSFVPNPPNPMDGHPPPPHLVPLPHPGPPMHQPPPFHRGSLPNISSGGDPNQPGAVLYYPQHPDPNRVIQYAPPPVPPRSHSLTINPSAALMNGNAQGPPPVLYTPPPSGGILRNAPPDSMQPPPPINGAAQNGIDETNQVTLTPPT